MARLLSAGEVRQILCEVVAEIARDSLAASIHVIGGAAMSFHNPERTATTDVDGYIRPVEAGQVLSVIQARWGLDAEWFNDKALGLRPPVAVQRWGGRCLGRTTSSCTPPTLSRCLR